MAAIPGKMLGERVSAAVKIGGCCGMRCSLSCTLQGEMGEAITLMAPAAFQSGLSPPPMRPRRAGAFGAVTGGRSSCLAAVIVNRMG